MQLDLNQLSLPTHILLALRGDISAGNTIDNAPINAPKRPKALNSEVTTVYLAPTIDNALNEHSASNRAIDAIDSPYYEIDVHSIEGDNTHIDIS